MTDTVTVKAGTRITRQGQAYSTLETAEIPAVPVDPAKVQKGAYFFVACPDADCRKRQAEVHPREAGLFGGNFNKALYTRTGWPLPVCGNCNTPMVWHDAEPSAK